MNRIENTTQMKNQTFGVEVEMARITRRNCASAIQRYFNNKYNLCYSHWDSHRENGYHAWSAIDQKGREWKCVSDCSIADADDGCEMVTPILTYEDIEDLQSIVRMLREMGAKSNSAYGCGVHIHVGVKDLDGGRHNAHTLRNLVNIINSHQRLIANAIGFSESRGQHYCQFLDSTFVDELNSKKPRTMEELKTLHYYTLTGGWSTDQSDQHYSNTRYYFLNLHAVFTKGTVEFRCFEFHKNMHAGELKAYIQLCLAMSNYAKTVAYASPKEITTNNEKYTMKNWLVNMGFVGDEFKTARMMLLKRLTGDTAYRNARPLVQRSELDDLGIE